MKLKRLIIQGFKSFKDKTTIHFDDGITGIVGPNGCGKSNIVDALFWIMGEQSAKHLRGANMKDLIFSGSSKYQPANFAQASLILENDDGKHVHIGNKVVCPTEIQLTRKLYRNGDTEYRINGEPARLKDIQEVFMDTGAGAKSYSIIAQGEINRLVQSKPEERRVIIEEVAGITKFKLRRRDSLKKMEQTEENLKRLSDLKVEIERNLSGLKKQAEKAERARTLKSKIEKGELSVAGHKIYDLLKDFREHTTYLNENLINLESWKTEKESLEIDLEGERALKDVHIKKIEAIQSEYNEISRILAGKEERLKNLCETLSSKEKLLEDKKNELLEINEDKESRTERLSEVQERLSNLNESMNEEINFDELAEEVEHLKEQFLEEKSILQEIKNELQILEKSLLDKNNEHFKLDTRLNEISGQLEDITEEMDGLESQYSSVNKEMSNEREALKEKEESVNYLKEMVAEQNDQIKNLEVELRADRDNFREKERHFIQTTSKLQTLIKLNESMEGVNEGTKQFLKSSQGSVFNLISANLECPSEYTKSLGAVANILGEAIIGESEDLNLWWNENQDKRLEIARSLESNYSKEEIFERLKINGAKEIVNISEVLTGSSSNILKNLLNNSYIVDIENSADLINFPKDLKLDLIVSKDGQTAIVNQGGMSRLILGAHIGRENNTVERNNLIKELSLESEELESDVSILKEKMETQEENLSQFIQERDEVNLKLRASEEDFIRAKAQLDSKAKSYQSNQSRVDILSNRKSKISSERLELLEKVEAITQFIDSIKKQIDEKKDISTTREEELNDLESIYSEKRDSLSAKEAERKTYSSQITSLEDQIQDIQNQLERLETRNENVAELIEETGENIINSQEEMRELEVVNRETAKELEEKTDILSAARDELEKLLFQMQDREEKVKKLNKVIAEVEKNMTSKEVKIEQILTEEEHITRDIFERFHVDLREEIARFLEIGDEIKSKLLNVSNMYLMETENGPEEIEKKEYTFVRRFGQDLKDLAQRLRSNKTALNGLGEINWQAVEDYDRQKLRFDFLTEQENELKASLVDLNTAISQIDEKSKLRFKTAFDEVNSKFSQVFPIIFGGGEARLELKGTLDDHDCGVDIIAKPPGKKMQNINLMSGGEKAMTAVSLIFSVFLVKPSPFCLLDEVDAPLDDANVGRFSELLREMSKDSQFILITHNKKTMELNDTLYGVTMQEPGVSKALSVQLH